MHRCGVARGGRKRGAAAAGALPVFVGGGGGGGGRVRVVVLVSVLAVEAQGWWQSGEWRRAPACTRRTVKRSRRSVSTCLGGGARARGLSRGQGCRQGPGVQGGARARGTARAPSACSRRARRAMGCAAAAAPPRRASRAWRRSARSRGREQTRSGEMREGHERSFEIVRDGGGSRARSRGARACSSRASICFLP